MTLLQLFPGGGILSPLLLDGPAIHKGGLAGVVVGSDHKVDPSVDAHHIVDVGIQAVRHLKCDRDMQIEPPMPQNQFGSAKAVDVIVEVLLHTLGVVAQLDPASQGVHGEFVLVEGVIPVPHQIDLGELELRLNPLALVSKDRLVFGGHRPQHRLGHLGLQSKLGSQGAIECGVQRSQPEIMGFVYVFGDMVAGLPVGVHSDEQLLFIICRGFHPYFSCNGEL